MSKSYFIYGIHSVTTFLKHSSLNVLEIFVQEGRRNERIEEIIELVRVSGLKFQFVSDVTLERLVGDVNHQGVLLRVKEEKGAREEDLFDLLEGLSSVPCLLILDQVQDPHNLGACLRSAEAAGVHAVIASKDRSVGLTSVVRKVASGAAESLPFIQVTNLARTMKVLQEKGIWMVGTDDQGSQSLYEVDLSGPIAIVMGAEESGLRRLTREHCDHLVRIPMMGKMESLNVSVAAGVVLFEALRQRQIKH